MIEEDKKKFTHPDNTSCCGSRQMHDTVHTPRSHDLAGVVGLSPTAGMLSETLSLPYSLLSLLNCLTSLNSLARSNTEFVHHSVSMILGWSYNCILLNCCLLPCYTQPCPSYHYHNCDHTVKPRISTTNASSAFAVACCHCRHSATCNHLPLCTLVTHHSTIMFITLICHGYSLPANCCVYHYVTLTQARC